MFLSALIFLIGHFFRIPYLRETELGWILTTLIGGVLVLGFGFMWYWKDQVNAKKAPPLNGALFHGGLRKNVINNLRGLFDRIHGDIRFLR